MDPDLVSKYAKRFGGKFGALNQVDYMEKYVPGGQGGICYGLCLSYISLRAKGINFHSVRKQEATWIFAHALQLRYENFHDYRVVASRLVPECIRATASLVGLRALGGILGVDAPYTDVSNALRSHRGGALLIIGKHACAVFKEADGRVRFFEPNYGQATFIAWQNFIAFLSCFIHDHEIERQYGFALSKKISVYWYELV